MNLVKQNVIKTVVLVVILCGLGLYYRFYVIKGGQKRQEVEEEAKKVFQIDRDKVTEFRVARASEEEIVCKKIEDRWHIEKPVEAGADQDTVNRVVSEFVDTKRTRTVDEEPEDLTPYGLDEPSLTLSAVVEDLSEPATILFGGQNPAKTGVYAKTANGKTVFLVQSYSQTSMDKGLLDLRDKKIADFQKYEVQALQLVRGELKIGVEKRDDGTWMMTEPLETRADATEIDKILDKMQTSTIKEFVNEEPENLGQYGLDSPEIELTMLIGEDKASKTVLVGTRNADKQGYYAKRAEQKNVFLLEEDVVEGLPQKADTLRDHSLLTVNTGDVRRMEYVTEEGKSVLAINDEGAWEIKEPVEEKADDLQVNDLITDMKNIKAKELLDEAKEEFGFAQPLITARLWKKESDKAIVVTIGATDADENLVYALNMDGYPMAFDSSELDKITKTLFDLRDKRLVSFDTTNVLRMTVRYGDHGLTVAQEDEKWIPEKPEGLKIGNQSYVDSLVWVINNVTMTQIAQENKPEDLTGYGLDKPRAEFSVELTDQRSIGPLLIGDSSDTNVYVVTEGKPGVYLVEDRILGNMRRELGTVLNETLPAPVDLGKSEAEEPATPETPSD